MTIAELEPLLIAGAHELDVPLNAKQRQQLLRLLAEVDEWNGRFNLTAIREPPEMLRKHLLDSLSVHAYLHGESVADVGSGAGFPGLPLAVANAQRQFTLIEATSKKARFLHHVNGALGLSNVQVVNARAEAWEPPQRFDCVISRALGRLQEFVRVTEHLCAGDGRLLAMKGQYPVAELDTVPGGWRIVAIHRLRVPSLDAERHLVELMRAQASP
jgi:16S rRNA (guanine527-N7)-methyltransferase